VSDGIRTRDRRDHNPELYQLSYAHQARGKSSGAQGLSEGADRAACSGNRSARKPGLVALDRIATAWDRRRVPALTLRPAPLDRVVALRALPAVVSAVAGGAWLALMVALVFGADPGTTTALWIGVAGACACVSGLMVGAGGNAAAAAVLAVASVAAVVLAAGDAPAATTVRGPTFDRADRPAADQVPAKPQPQAKNEGRQTPRGAGLVRSYYAALDAGQFAKAWARLTPEVKAAFGGFEVWRRGYETTLGHRVQDVRRLPGHRIRHTLVATDRTACGTTTQRFAVTWRLAGGHATALHAVKLAGEDPAAAC
jgi:hypothetical protein